VFNSPVCLYKGYFSNLDQFISKLPEEEKFVPMGEMIHSFAHAEQTYQVYKACAFHSVIQFMLICNVPVPEWQYFAVQACLQTFVLFSSGDS
jgi:hypothetical protein